MNLALIPAAGKSSRMGCAKLTLPLAGRSVLEHAISALREGGVEQILVVVGSHVPELVPLARAAGAHTLLLTEETRDMRATVEQGLDWLTEHFHPTAEDRWLLLPADHPTLDAAVVKILLQASREHPSFSIIVPTFEGLRGHPTLIGWHHVAEIRQWPAEQGLNAYFRGQRQETLELPVQSSSVVSDLDTPEDLARLQQSHRDRAT